MDLHRTHIIKKILCITLLISLFGCDRNKPEEKLSDNYDKLHESMQAYLDEKDLPTYTGKYVEIKVKGNVIKYLYNEGYVYIYTFLIAPIYNQKTRIEGIELSSVEYGNEVKKFYYPVNSSFGKLNSNFRFEGIENLISLEYQFFLEDNSKMYSYELTDEMYESCLTDICVTVKINGYKDKIILDDLVIVDYNEEDTDNYLIETIKKNNALGESLHTYSKDYSWIDEILGDN